MNYITLRVQVAIHNNKQNITTLQSDYKLFSKHRLKPMTLMKSNCLLVSKKFRVRGEKNRYTHKWARSPLMMEYVIQYPRYNDWRTHPL